MVLLRRGRDWLLQGFPLLWVPACSRGDGGWVINYSAAIGVDERLACQIKFTRDQRAKSDVSCARCNNSASQRRNHLNYAPHDRKGHTQTRPVRGEQTGINNLGSI